MKQLLTELAPNEMKEYFGEFDNEMFSRLVYKTKIIELPQMGQEIYQPGASADYFYFIFKGCVTLQKTDNQHKKPDYVAEKNSGEPIQELQFVGF